MMRFGPILLLLSASMAGAQVPCKAVEPDAHDAVIASPANHTVLFEDADVRVLDVHSQPHTREVVHTHRMPSVMYVERQGAGTYDAAAGSDHRSHPTDPNYKPRVIAIKAEGPHWTENTGEVPFHAIRVEFKHPGCGMPGWKPAAPGPDDALEAAPATHTLLFENDEVRVLDVHLAPHAKDEFHTDPWPAVVYVVRGAPVRDVDANGKVELRTSHAAGSVYADEAQGRSVENAGDVPLHLIRFELKYGTAQ